MISRISMVGQKSDFANAWYPSAEVDMKFFAIQNKAKLLKYVMHAKHRRPDMKISKLSDQFDAERFEEILKKAQPFLQIEKEDE